MVPTTGDTGVTTTDSRSMIPELSGASLSSLIKLLQGMLTTELDRRFGPINDQQRQESNPIPAIQQITQSSQSTSQSTPQDPKDSPPIQAAATTAKTEIRAEEVGYFDPEYKQEQGTTSGPVVNAGKHVYYRDVYIFVDRLKDLANRSSHAVKHLPRILRRNTLKCSRRRPRYLIVPRLLIRADPVLSQPYSDQYQSSIRSSFWPTPVFHSANHSASHSTSHSAIKFASQEEEAKSEDSSAVQETQGSDPGPDPDYTRHDTRGGTLNWCSEQA